MYIKIVWIQFDPHSNEAFSDTCIHQIRARPLHVYIVAKGTWRLAHMELYASLIISHDRAHGLP